MDKAASHASETAAMRKLMERFDDCKEKFDPLDTRDIRLDLPPPLENLSIPGVVRSGEITIKR
jgi:hypothetical protein